MTDALRAIIDGKVIYALTTSSAGRERRQAARGYEQDPETFETQRVTLTARTLARVRQHGETCELWETPAWCDTEVPP